MLFESRELEVVHTVLKELLAGPREGVGRVVWANIWELGEMRGHEAPVTCRTLSMTRNLDLCLIVEGKYLLKHYRLV